MENSIEISELNESFKPIFFSPKNEEDRYDLKKLQASGNILFFDSFDLQLSELIKAQNPTKTLSQEEMAEKTQEYYSYSGLPASQNGVWVYYPWRNTVVRILEEEEFIKLRTIRNRYKITDEEQEVLQKKIVGIIGLSVGQSVAISLAMERCFGEIRIADFDRLDLSNMNRIRTGIYNIGLKKSWIVAREIAEIDPYLKVTLYNEGIIEDNINDFFNLNGKMDLLIEECDSLPIKLLSRIKAKALKIPVLMDTSDRGMMDIERFDLEPARLIFHGLLAKFGPEEKIMSRLSQSGKEMMMSLLQFENLSQRVKFSFSELGKSITSWPQLASSVFLGGAACCHYARLLLLGQKIDSGRFYVDLDKIINFNES